jgi:hypothetical protein
MAVRSPCFVCGRLLIHLSICSDVRLRCVGKPAIRSHVYYDVAFDNIILGTIEEEILLMYYYY